MPSKKDEFDTIIAIEGDVLTAYIVVPTRWSATVTLSRVTLAVH